jgi:uncharacterized protein (DUF433 family)
MCFLLRKPKIINGMTIKKEARITADPAVMAGKPVFAGTRIPVDAVIQRIAEGLSIEEVLQDYPNLHREDIKAALRYGAALVRGESIVPI